METVIKILKALLFAEGGDVDIPVVVKFRYMLVGIMLGMILTVCGALYFFDDDEAEVEGENVEYIESSVE